MDADVNEVDFLTVAVVNVAIAVAYGIEDVDVLPVLMPLLLMLI